MRLQAKRLLKIVLLVSGLQVFVTAQALQDADSLKQLYDTHRIFELRDALEGRSAPPFYLGVVAAAMNRAADAERYLRRAISEASTIESVNEAREWLIDLYLRLGRSSEAVRLIDDALNVAPSRSDMRNARGLFESIIRYRDQTVRTSRRQTFPCEVSAQGVVVPLSVNGKAVHWFVDTAFSLSALSESEARMLGLLVQAGGQTEDLAGGTAPARTAVANRVSIGGTELQDVPFLVYPDSQPPWDELPAGRRGAVGLPVVMALRRFGWTSKTTCEAGAAAARKAVGERSNLVFDGSAPLVRVRYAGRPLDFILDTGNQAGTQLWTRFSREFDALIRQQGRTSERRVTQIGGAAIRTVVVLPELRLRIDALEGVLRPAEVFSLPVGDDVHHGNLGMDLLSQANAVMIDFSSMSLALQ
jgi:Aspartyl protease